MERGGQTWVLRTENPSLDRLASLEKWLSLRELALQCSPRHVSISQQSTSDVKWRRYDCTTVPPKRAAGERHLCTGSTVLCPISTTQTCKGMIVFTLAVGVDVDPQDQITTWTSHNAVRTTTQKRQSSLGSHLRLQQLRTVADCGGQVWVPRTENRLFDFLGSLAECLGLGVVALQYRS